jgi:hypothetical protein
MDFGLKPETPPLVFVRCDPAQGETFLAWKVPVVPYGSEGVEPRDAQDCPYFHAHHDSVTCVSGSGGSMCGGFMGGWGGYVYCNWGLWGDD